MIKRRFYRHDHDERNIPSDSSSSSGSEVEAEATEDTEEEVDEEVVVKEKDQHYSSSSGYESEDSSAHEVDLDSSGLLTNDDEMEAGKERHDLRETHLHTETSVEINNIYNAADIKDAVLSGIPDCVFRSKSVFKCKLCPRIVCLNEETLMDHLKSKRHARSEKLLREGRLRLMLNSDGEIEGETHQERHAATLASVQSNQKPSNSKKNKGRQRQRMRLKKKESKVTSDGPRISAKPAKKKQRRNI